MICGLPIADDEVFASWIDPCGLAISPDGLSVGMLYLRAGHFRLGVFPTIIDESPREMPLPCGQPGGLAWSPDGNTLAFHANHLDSQEANIFVVDVPSANTSALMTEPGWRAFSPSWSLDSTMLAFSAYLIQREPPQPRLFVVSLREQTVKQVTSGEFSDITPRFSSDGETLAFRRGWEIWLLSLTNRSQRPLIEEGGNELHHSCFAPDGTEIVVQRDFDRGGQIRIANTETGAIRELTDMSTASLRPSWSPDGASISFVRNRERVIVTSPDGVTLWEAAPSNGRVYAGVSSGPVWARTRELLTLLDGDGNAWVAGPTVVPTEVTHFAAPPRITQKAKHVRYPSTGGAEVPALLLEPRGFVRGRNPVVIWLHGGGSNGATELRLPHASSYLGALLEAGFGVLIPDYRGTSGHGDAWEWVLPEQRGVVDVDDVVAAKSFLESNGLAAPNKVAVAGYSYGGYLTFMALARLANELSCAVSLCGALDPIHLSTLWSLDKYWTQLPDLTHVTPLNLLDKMRAPLLIIHGAEDTTSTLQEVNRAYESLRSNGTHCDLHIFQDTHGLPLHTSEATDLLVSFLIQHTGLR